MAATRTQPPRTAAPDAVATVSERANESQGYFKYSTPRANRPPHPSSKISVPASKICESCYLQLNQLMDDHSHLLPMKWRNVTLFLKPARPMAAERAAIGLERLELTNAL